ncbi:MAG: aminopeptidase N, partial [Planctomycetota bacterium]
MNDAPTATVRLADYRPPDYEVLGLELAFDLHAHRTRVVARTRFRRRGSQPAPLRLDGERLKLVHIALDGKELPPTAYSLESSAIAVHRPPAEGMLEVTTELNPADNTALEGLYMSGGRYCTQCEAEGFRTITYAFDRPDVMTRYTVRIEADRESCPTLLSNGNLTAHGELPNGRHFVQWHDPHPKPTYLFALAAGRYDSIAGSFTTMSGRRIALGIHVDPGEAERAHYAMDCLQRAMRWDEQKFAREYDLDVFHIVAVRDFNFGAMENKGLNIFNSAYILADPESATDSDCESIEAVVGHEYFHNWTGNRITCRDWFQLSLKEGLTVFREQEFCADQRSHAVQRIKDVRRLRSRQFSEDAGPLAHAVRPASYQKIDNFYTATVYEKGSEVIRMLREVVGADAFARGMQLYFTRRDGTASTVEDFVGCFAEAAAMDLGPFLRWYEQAGTPLVTVRGEYDAATLAFALTVQQTTAPTPGQPDKHPLQIPLRIGLLADNGSALAAVLDGEATPREEHALVLGSAEATFRFTGVCEAPIPAVLRGFCAPVRLDDGLTNAQRFVQMAHDADPFTRWDAGQTLAIDAMVAAVDGGLDADAAAGLAAALARELDRAEIDPAFAALALRLPDLGELLHRATFPDPNGLFAAREALRRHLATTLRTRLETVIDAAPPASDSLTARATGERALRSTALDLLAALGPAVEARLYRAFEEA